MESEMCSLQKFWFCKFKGDCKNRHFAEIYEDLEDFKDIIRCRKKHPKPWKKYTSVNGCRHGEKYAYTHDRVTKHDEERDKLKEKVHILERKITNITSIDNPMLERLEVVLKALTRKVLGLESEIEKCKAKKKKPERRLLKLL